MMSGRSLTLCDRSPQSYEHLGIVEGVHAAMFNSTAEFYGQVMYYTRPENERERMRMVASARQLALARHTWGHRARTFEEMLRGALTRAGRKEDGSALKIEHIEAQPRADNHNVVKYGYS